MASNRRFTKRNPYTERTLVYYELEKLVTCRNLKECQVLSPPGNPNFETFHSIVHVGSEYLELVDIHVDSIYVAKLPPKPLIYLQNLPLGFYQEVRSSFKPFLKNPINPPYIEACNIILQNLMANLGGGRAGGNQPPPPPLNRWVMA